MSTTCPMGTKRKLLQSCVIGFKLSNARPVSSAVPLKVFTDQAHLVDGIKLLLSKV